MRAVKIVLFYLVKRVSCLSKKSKIMPNQLPDYSEHIKEEMYFPYRAPNYCDCQLSFQFSYASAIDFSSDVFWRFPIDFWLQWIYLLTTVQHCQIIGSLWLKLLQWTSFIPMSQYQIIKTNTSIHCQTNQKIFSFQ